MPIRNAGATLLASLPRPADELRTVRVAAVGEAARSPAGPASAKKYSALDAAALVLRESGQPMSCPELIARMAAKGYWTSPKGKTPSSTLYAAMD